jgi:fluoroacetyl-CoA thioesterase
VELDAVDLVRSFPVGISAQAELVVGEEHLAPERGVLSTPRMIGLMEQASSRAVGSLLPGGWTTVGTEVCVRHLAATLPGERVVATASLIEARGRRLKFPVEASNGSRKIGEGTHERAVVHLERFTMGARSQGSRSGQ